MGWGSRVITLQLVGEGVDYGKEDSLRCVIDLRLFKVFRPKRWEETCSRSFFGEVNKGFRS